MIQTVQRKVYFSPTARRHFFTRRAALRAEASARIMAKYPTEKQERDEVGRVTYGGWHWSEDDRLQRLHARLVRLLKAFPEADTERKGRGA